MRDNPAKLFCGARVPARCPSLPAPLPLPPSATARGNCPCLCLSRYCCRCLGFALFCLSVRFRLPPPFAGAWVCHSASQVRQPVSPSTSRCLGMVCSPFDRDVQTLRVLYSDPMAALVWNFDLVLGDPGKTRRAVQVKVGGTVGDLLRAAKRKIEATRMQRGITAEWNGNLYDNDGCLWDFSSAADPLAAPPMTYYELIEHRAAATKGTAVAGELWSLAV